ncbi:hypothetical protein [Mollivirus kamchatka]|nr:hypothetical protein [Mollivirus kamchatka]
MSFKLFRLCLLASLLVSSLVLPSSAAAAGHFDLAFPSRSPSRSPVRSASASPVLSSSPLVSISPAIPSGFPSRSPSRSPVARSPSPLLTASPTAVFPTGSASPTPLFPTASASPVPTQSPLWPWVCGSASPTAVPTAGVSPNPTQSPLWPWVCGSAAPTPVPAAPMPAAPAKAKARACERVPFSFDGMAKLQPMQGNNLGGFECHSREHAIDHDGRLTQHSSNNYYEKFVLYDKTCGCWLTSGQEQSLVAEYGARGGLTCIETTINGDLAVGHVTESVEDYEDFETYRRLAFHRVSDGVLLATQVVTGYEDGSVTTSTVVHEPSTGHVIAKRVEECSKFSRQVNADVTYACESDYQC